MKTDTPISDDFGKVMRSQVEWYEKCRQLERELGEAQNAHMKEHDICKNLQHVIVSSQGVDAIGRTIKTIRETEKTLGPFGPINDYHLAEILSATLQLPAELIIAKQAAELTQLRAVAEGLAGALANFKGEYGFDQAALATYEAWKGYT